MSDLLNIRAGESSNSLQHGKIFVIKFLKIGPYNPKQKNKSSYESVKDLLIGTNDPNMDIKKANNFRLNKKYLNTVDCILYSEHKRSEETFKYIKPLIKNGAYSQKTKLLNEILFDISEIQEDVYNKEKSNSIRNLFIKKFINNSLYETRVELKRRIKDLEELNSTLSKEYKNVLCISHTFFIKLYLTVKNDQKILTNKPKRIKKYINPNQRIMEFFEIKYI